MHHPLTPHRVLAIAALTLALSSASAQEPHRASEVASPACSLSTNPHKIELDLHHVQGDVRAFYTRKGPHALYTKEDVNNNGVPDMVEDAVTHVHAVRGALNLNGFQDPLRSARFSSARFIDIDFLNFPVYSEERTGNRALAFSRVLRTIQRGDVCAISIAIHSQSPNNHERIKGFLIPHEVFHLYQYGHTMFRQSWFLEGMAKWVEWLLTEENTRNPVLWNTPLPQNADDLNRQVLSNPNPYDVRHFWNRLAELVAPHEPPPRYPDELSDLTFADGSPVLRDRTWRGHAFMREVLAAMRAQEQRLSVSMGRPSQSWTDAEQRSPRNNTFVIEAVQQVLARRNLPDAEVRRFLAISLDIENPSSPGTAP